MATADKLVRDLAGIGDAASFADETERVRARDALLEALRKVQSPWDIVWDHNWVQAATYSCIKTFVDAGVFDRWAAAGGGARTSAELAELSGVEEQVVRRMLRHLAGQHLVTETAEDTYAPTAWSTAMTADKTLAPIYDKFSDLQTLVFRNLPHFLRETGWRNPSDVKNCNMQHSAGVADDFFEYVARDATLSSSFHCAMESHSKYNLTPWPSVYPTDDIIANARPGRALVVDVGGSKGYDLEKFRLRHPDIPDGSLVLQDLPDVIEGVESNGALTVMAYDFFTPQPVLGARAYFMHTVLHDWTDDMATRILANVAAGMERGYSRLLVHESLVSNVKPLARVTTSDITMMAILAAKERSEAEWRELLERAGLRIIKIWRPVHSVESIIEAELI